MKDRIPYYYKKFSCIGPNCEDTCCKNWNIGIDQESYRHYRKIPGAFGRQLRKEIDPQHRVFRLHGGECGLLDADGLCQIQKELGHGSLCRACRMYPRHVEDFGVLREWMLSMSCPEAARVILADETQGAGIVRGREESAGHADLPWLLEARHAVIRILKNREVSWEQRQAMALAFAHDLQRHLAFEEKGNAAESQTSRTLRCQSVVRTLAERYLDSHAPVRFGTNIRPFCGQFREARIRMAAWMRELQNLEAVLPGWNRKIGNLCTKLYHRQGWEDAMALEHRFSREASCFQQEWENLTLYFIYTWFLGALYDGNLYGKVKLALASSQMIREWCLFRFAKTGQMTAGEIVAAAYRFSRGIENSDENMNGLEHLTDCSPLFSLQSMMLVICKNVTIP